MNILILSGGMDSVTLLHYLVKGKKESIGALSFNYGQKQSKELLLAARHCKDLQVPHKILDVSFIKGLTDKMCALTSDTIAVPSIKEVLGDAQPISYCPNRNMMFLSMAAAACENEGGNTVYYGAQQHDQYSGYWDTTSMFRDAMTAVLSQNRKTQIRIEAPFVDMHKWDIIELGVKLGVDYSKTWTCYKGEEKSCGICPTCADRIMAFATAGFPDPLEYQIVIDWDILIKKVAK